MLLNLLQLKVIFKWHLHPLTKLHMAKHTWWLSMNMTKAIYQSSLQFHYRTIINEIILMIKSRKCLQQHQPEFTIQTF